MKKLIIAFSISILISLCTTPVYPQYCSKDTTHLTGELGTNGYTLVTRNIIKCKDATYSSDGGLSGQDAIILAPNFHVKAGVNFRARVSACRSTKPYLNAPSENAVMDNGCMDNSDWRFWAFKWNPVEGALEYQLYVKRQNETSPEIDDIIIGSTIAEYLYQTPIPNSRLDNWEAKVRAKVNGEWTPWYGGQGEQPLVFSVEPVSTDCAPVITAPLPQATLDNGCSNANEVMSWHFTWTAVAGAIGYQIFIKHPSRDKYTFIETVTSNSWTSNHFININDYYTGWTAKVRANVDGLWGDFHGSTLAEEVMLFNVEHVDTDCAPLIISPKSSPKETLDNGCNPPEGFNFDWVFAMEKKDIFEAVEFRINRPDGSIYRPVNTPEITTIEDEGQNRITYIYRVFNEYIPANELENWTLQARSRINGFWTGWFGSTLTTTQTYFDVAPPTANCTGLVDVATTSRNQVTNGMVDKSLDLQVFPNPFHESCTIEYSLVKESEVILEVYTLTGQLVTSLVKGKKESGIHTALFERNQSLPAGILIVRLQVDGEVHYRKLVMEN